MADSDTLYDVIVIGAGPGGYVCAIRAAQLGLKVACVEKRATLGGTCLNVGCIPSKAMLQASEKYEEAVHGLDGFGVKTGKVSLDMDKFMGHKDATVQSNVQGIEFLFKKNKVDWLKGTGKLCARDAVDVDGTVYRTKTIVLATGSDHFSVPGVTIDEDRIVSSTGALSLPKVPKSMVVIGGGYIGLELGSVWQRLGAEVTVVEYLDRILPGMDRDLSKEMNKILAKQGITFKLGTKVKEAKAQKSGVKLTVEPAAGGEEETLQADYVLVAVGRRPYTDGLNLEDFGVQRDDKGRVVTDHAFRSTVDNIYAIGDVIAGPMLAHKAEEEGVALAEILAGQTGHVNYDAIPGVVYTYPEAATVGKTEDALKAEGVQVKIGRFPFSANGRARAMNATQGFVKVIADKQTDRVLGVHIIGAEAGTMIAECAMAMEFGATAEDIYRTCHAHPTLNEAVKEAALAVDGRPIHM